MSDAKDVYVIMPFSLTASCSAEQWSEIYEAVFKPAVEGAGFSCERALPETGSLIGSIVSKLRHARIVLADITDRNPNVFYELGVRHSLSKRTIIVTQNSDHVPSDLRGYWFLKYGTSPGQVVEFRKEIGRLLASIEENPDKPDSPVSDYLEQENINITSFINTDNVKKLTALYTEFTGNLVLLQRMRDRRPANAEFISTDCIRLLLTTLYLDVGMDLLKRLYELSNELKVLQLSGIPLRSIDSTIVETQLLADSILAIRNRLAQDQYEEPEQLSSMVWRAVDSSFPLGCDYPDRGDKWMEDGIKTGTAYCGRCGAAAPSTVSTKGRYLCPTCDPTRRM